MKFSNRTIDIAAKAEADSAPVFKHLEDISKANTEKVMDAFASNRVSDTMFAPSTGYGYDDRGRDTLDRVFAAALGADCALVRPHMINGTHAIACALFGALRPGDTLLSLTGAPYDTLMETVSGKTGGSLAEFGVKYAEIPLMENGEYDGAAHLKRVRRAVGELRPRAVFIQRSRGYAIRPCLSVGRIGKIIAEAKAAHPGVLSIVDNCYGEFTEAVEPVSAGADLVCGSLIKNLGGGLAPTGGYVAGDPELCELAACRLTVPGIGGEAGSFASGYRLFYQGLFLAPHTVLQAMKAAVFAARAFELAGFPVSPAYDEARSDIIQTVSFGAKEPLLEFLKGIQAGSPVDSFVTPIPSPMPGYESEVAMAAGAFVQGASVELSADAPMRPPYTAFLQGGLTFESARLGIMNALELSLSASEMR